MKRHLILISLLMITFSSLIAQEEFRPLNSSYSETRRESNWVSDPINQTYSEWNSNTINYTLTGGGEGDGFEEGESGNPYGDANNRETPLGEGLLIILFMLFAYSTKQMKNFVPTSKNMGKLGIDK
ncbi:hypothetical protein LJB98_02430 [Bacteroidales bacterium OttesenSCG-928-M11]|nr:hypothetical protein [Bacteroidales bacterium OttesenSCG-928-M11]